jgi:hypothetical protein
MHPIQDLFLKSFSYELQFDMHFYMHSYLYKNFILVKKWVLHMSRVTSSYFAKYFCDTYFEYITPCIVMTYATSYMGHASAATCTMLAGYDLVRLSG